MVNMVKVDRSGHSLSIQSPWIAKGDEEAGAPTPGPVKPVRTMIWIFLAYLCPRTPEPDYTCSWIRPWELKPRLWEGSISVPHTRDKDPRQEAGKNMLNIPGLGHSILSFLRDFVSF